MPTVLTSLGCSVLPAPKFGDFLRDPTTLLCNAAEQSSQGWTRQSKVRCWELTLVASGGRSGPQMDPKLCTKGFGGLEFEILPGESRAQTVRKGTCSCSR